MKLLIHLFIALLSTSIVLGQDTKEFEFQIDSLVLDGINYSPSTITSNIQVGKQKYYTILDRDSIAMRIRVRLTKRGSQPKKMKIRIDLYEDGKWYKPPIFIDIHNLRRFRIRRDQCWSRTSITYNVRFPMGVGCNCWKPLKGKTSHEFYFRATGIAK